MNDFLMLCLKQYIFSPKIFVWVEIDIPLGCKDLKTLELRIHSLSGSNLYPGNV